MNVDDTAVSQGLRPISQCAQTAGNMCRNIELTNGQVNHVGEVVQVAISGSAILDDFDNSVEAFSDGIGQVPVGKSDDVIEVISHCADELAQ